MLNAYVYKVTNRVTGQFYFGSRTNNVAKGRTPEQDLWKHYFTSSKAVRALVEEHGIDSFVVEILFQDPSYENCFWEEQRLIIESKDHPMRLNKTYVDPATGKKALTTYNETAEEKALRAAKISANKKGRFNSNGHYGLKRSEETKEKMRLAQAKRGYRHSEEVKKSISQAQKEKIEKMTDEERKTRFGHLKGKPWSAARRAAQLKKGKANGNSSV